MVRCSPRCQARVRYWCRVGSWPWGRIARATTVPSKCNATGIAPVKESSGKTNWVHFRQACPTFLRQTFHEFALHSIGQSEWAKADCQHLREDGNKTHQAAVRSLAYKWIRIIFRCWKDGKPYDEEVYLQSLRRRGSLIVGALGLPTGAGRQTVAGFQKLSKNNA